jgi:hypothetical protein
MLAEVLAYAALSAIIHVPGDAPDPQAGVDLAVAGDTVLLAVGVHRGPVDMLGKAITLRGEDVELTVLLGDPTSSVLCFVSGEGFDTVVADLTIAGGGGTEGDGGLRHGGGLCMEQASPTVRHCLIVGNTADAGPAVWIDGGAPLFEECWFHGNVGGGAGSITCTDSSPRLLRCGFHGEGIGWWDGPMISVRSDCDVPGGACCLGSHCVQTTAQACSEAGGFWTADAACGSGVCPEVCVEDVNGDRRVNMTDMLLVLDAWGMCL